MDISLIGVVGALPVHGSGTRLPRVFSRLLVTSLD